MFREYKINVLLKLWGLNPVIALNELISYPHNKDNVKDFWHESCTEGKMYKPSSCDLHPARSACIAWWEAAYGICTLYTPSSAQFSW